MAISGAMPGQLAQGHADLRCLSSLRNGRVNPLCMPSLRRGGADLLWWSSWELFHTGAKICTGSWFTQPCTRRFATNSASPTKICTGSCFTRPCTRHLATNSASPTEICAGSCFTRPWTRRFATNSHALRLTGTPLLQLLLGISHPLERHWPTHSAGASLSLSEDTECEHQQQVCLFEPLRRNTVGAPEFPMISHDFP